MSPSPSQKCGEEARFEFDRDEAVKVGEDTTEGCLSVQVGGERTISPSDQNIKKSHTVVVFNFICE